MRQRFTASIPAIVVGAVLALSFALPGGTFMPRSLPVDYGYGFPPAPLNYHAVTPARILDTRTSTGGVTLGANASEDITVAGHGGVPVGATSAVFNVTVTNTTGHSFLTIFPKGTVQPLASNANWTARQTVANLVEITLGTGGKVTIYNLAGSVDVIFDVQGYTAVPAGEATLDGLYNPLVPARILDTRNGTGAPMAMVGPGQTLDVQITGADGVPATGVEAVVLNVTVVNSTARGFVTVFPKGAALPLASNVNFDAGQTVPNRVLVKLGTAGKISIFNNSGSVDLVADVNGWLTDGTQGTAHGSLFSGQAPSRILDTRTSAGLPLGTNATLIVQVSGADGVPASGVVAAVLNVTVTGPTASSFLTVWPDGTARPLASDLNFVAGETVANLVIVKLGAGGKIDIYNLAGSTHVVVDVVGWFQGG